jgi:hypothetical protein
MSRLPLHALLLILGALLTAPSVAFAQDDDEDEDDGDLDEEEGRPKTVIDEGPRRSRQDVARERAAQRANKRPVREVYKGAYGKMSMGAIIWLGSIADYTTTSGTALDFTFGYDFLDRLNFTMTGEVNFYQVITNGQGSVAGLGFASPVQGDFRIVGGTANLRLGPNFVGRRVKRLHLAFQVGGGVGYSPRLTDLDSPNAAFGFASWNNRDMHNRALGLITPGVGLEYYTPLSHFSLGLDVDFQMIVGGPVFAMGVAPYAFFKYTF